jgi:hypothetical protein
MLHLNSELSEHAKQTAFAAMSLSYSMMLHLPLGPCAAKLEQEAGGSRRRRRRRGTTYESAAARISEIQARRPSPFPGLLFGRDSLER